MILLVNASEVLDRLCNAVAFLHFALLSDYKFLLNILPLITLPYASVSDLIKFCYILSSLHPVER